MSERKEGALFWLRVIWNGLWRPLALSSFFAIVALVIFVVIFIFSSAWEEMSQKAETKHCWQTTADTTRWEIPVVVDHSPPLVCGFYQSKFLCIEMEKAVCP